MNKHKTGPLRLTQNEEHDGQFSITGASDAEQHAQTYCHFGGYFGTYGPHVFLAAPELLNAARQALSDLEWIEKQASGSNMQASIILLRHAIRVAEGETNE